MQYLREINSRSMYKCFTWIHWHFHKCNWQLAWGMILQDVSQLVDSYSTSIWMIGYSYFRKMKTWGEKSIENKCWSQPLKYSFIENKLSKQPMKASDALLYLFEYEFVEEENKMVIFPWIGLDWMYVGMYVGWNITWVTNRTIDPDTAIEYTKHFFPLGRQMSSTENIINT